MNFTIQENTIARFVQIVISCLPLAVQQKSTYIEGDTTKINMTQMRITQHNENRKEVNYENENKNISYNLYNFQHPCPCNLWLGRLRDGN